MGAQAFKTVDVLRLDVEADPAGLVNLVQNPSGELGGWGWITTISGSKVSTASLLVDKYPALYPSTYSGDALPSSDTSLRFAGVAGASWFTTEDMPISAGQWAAARWNALGGSPGHFFRARFEWINLAGAVISSSVQTGYLAVASGVGNLGAVQAPAGTVAVRLRFDLYSNNTGTNPTGAHTFDFAEVTVAKAATSGALGDFRANLVPNPSFETNIMGWTAPSGTILRSTAQAAVGTSSLRHAAAGGSLDGPRTLSGRRGIPVAGNASYVVRCRARAATRARSITLQVSWYGADGALLATASVASAGSNTDAWTTVSGQVTSPAAAAFAQVRIQYGAAPDPSEQHFFDAFLIETAGTFTTYFDAATPDAGGWDYGGTTQPPLVLPTRTNLVPNPAPASLTGYTASAAATIGAVVGQLTVFPNSFASAADSFASVGGDLGGMRLGMQAGKTYTVSAELVSSVHVDTMGDRTDAIVVHHRIGAAPWTVLTTGTGGVQTPGRKSLTFTLPVGTSEAFIRLYHGGGGDSSSANTRWKQVMLEEAAAAGPYFDGATGATSDYSTYARAWTGTANNSTSTETETVTLPYATAVKSSLGYLAPVQYLNIIGESHELKVSREPLNVGTLDAVVISRALDPAESSLIRPGRRARLMSLVEGAWEEIVTGKLLEANVEYELKDPSVPDEKRSRISVSLVDANQPLAQAKRPQGVATIDELPFVLEGAGVPWNVNGSGNQIATATPTTFNADASALTQLALTRDTRIGYVWTSRRGVVNAWDPGSIPAPGPLVLNESDYSDLKVTYGTSDCINAVSFTVQTLGADGNTVETTYGPYEDTPSIEANGRYLKEFTVTGLSKAQVDTLAASILAANKTPVRRVQSVTMPLNTLARVNKLALIDLYDLVRVDNAELGLSAQLRVTGIEHSVQLKKWMLTLTFAGNGSVASPIFQPPVQSDANPDVGVIEWFAGPVAKIPASKLLCDGSSKAVASYPYLFAMIGYTYGGSGANFNVPNLVDRFAIGAGTKALGTTGGAPTKTLVAANLPPHSHVTGTNSGHLAYGGSAGSGPASGSGFGTPLTSISTGNGPGTSTPVDIMPPWLALVPVIRAA